MSLVPRCDKCLTKIYCSRECLKQDLKTKHGDACKKESDPRKVKVKEERKVRKEAEKTRVDECSTSLMKKIDSVVGINSASEKLKKVTLEAVEQFANSKM